MTREEFERRKKQKEELDALGAMASFVSTNLNTIDSMTVDGESHARIKANKINPRELYARATKKNVDLAQQLVNEGNIGEIDRSLPRSSAPPARSDLEIPPKPIPPP